MFITVLTKDRNQTLSGGAVVGLRTLESLDRAVFRSRSWFSAKFGLRVDAVTRSYSEGVSSSVLIICLPDEKYFSPSSVFSVTWKLHSSRILILHEVRSCRTAKISIKILESVIRDGSWRSPVPSAYYFSAIGCRLTSRYIQFTDIRYIWGEWFSGALHTPVYVLIQITQGQGILKRGCKYYVIKLY